MILSAVHIQPFDIISDFVFSEGRLAGIAVGGGDSWSQGQADVRVDAEGTWLLPLV